jgi:hypothetical protein
MPILKNPRYERFVKQFVKDKAQAVACRRASYSQSYS